MKTIKKLMTGVVMFLALATVAHAQSAREQLKHLTEQLQKAPTDNALREKIIKLANTMKPAPALPDTAIAFEGRAQFAFKSAKTEGDYLAAAQEYEKAVAAAPWVPGYYADLCTIYEKAGKYEDAKRHCEFYLVGVTQPARKTDVKRRIAGLEFGIEKRRRAAEEASSPQAREAALLGKVEGARFVARNTPENLGLKPGTMAWDDILDIRDGTLHIAVRIHYITSGSVYGHRQPGEYTVDRISYRDGAFTQSVNNGTTTYRIKPDAQALIRQYNGSEYKLEIPRN
jgi:tetratricopeptide (TPR) repeat protein